MLLATAASVPLIVLSDSQFQSRLRVVSGWFPDVKPNAQTQAIAAAVVYAAALIVVILLWWRIRELRTLRQIFEVPWRGLAEDVENVGILESVVRAVTTTSLMLVCGGIVFLAIGKPIVPGKDGNTGQSSTGDAVPNASNPTAPAGGTAAPPTGESPAPKGETPVPIGDASSTARSAEAVATLGKIREAIDKLNRPVPGPSEPVAPPDSVTGCSRLPGALAYEPALRGRTMYRRMDHELFFDAGSDRLSDIAQRRLSSILTSLRPGAQLTVTGEADRGSDGEDATTLPERRTKSVSDFAVVHGFSVISIPSESRHGMNPSEPYRRIVRINIWQPC